MSRRFKVLMLTFLAASFQACAPEVVPSTGPHDPTLPAQVKIYQKEPAKYEKLGMVSVVITSKEHWEKTADATPGFDKLRAQAAAKGANGLLLVDFMHQEYMQVGALYEERSYLVPLRRDPLTVVAEAIYVVQE